VRELPKLAETGPQRATAELNHGVAILVEASSQYAHKPARHAKNQHAIVLNRRKPYNQTKIKIIYSSSLKNYS